VRRAEEMLGDPVATETDPDTGGPVYIYDAGRESAAGLFAAMASGRATPIECHHGDFLAQSLTKARTKSDDRRAIAFLSAWCDQTGTSATLEAITRKEAFRLHDALPKLPGAPASPVTLNKYLGRLSVYWQWLVTGSLSRPTCGRGLRYRNPPRRMTNWSGPSPTRRFASCSLAPPALRCTT
jgi:hypothetical protein